MKERERAALFVLHLQSGNIPIFVAILTMFRSFPLLPSSDVYKGFLEVNPLRVLRRPYLLILHVLLLLFSYLFARLFRSVIARPVPVLPSPGIEPTINTPPIPSYCHVTSVLFFSKFNVVFLCPKTPMCVSSKFIITSSSSFD